MIAALGRPPRTLAVICLWIPATLWLDRFADVPGQVMLGLITSALLGLLLVPRPPVVRWQVGVVVVFATVVEVVFSGWLGVYEYRLGAVPAYVPAGHGLVYLAALDFAQWPLVRRRAGAVVTACSLVVAAVAVYALLGTRNDVLGAFWAVCLLAFLRYGRMPLLYVGAFGVVSYLEVLGTRWQVWTWQPVDTIAGWVPMGNPPSVAAGGYGWFDLVAVFLAAPLVGWVRARRDHRPAMRPSSSSCSSPLEVTALPAVSTADPSKPDIRPPASVTIGTSAATSQMLNSGSAAASTMPSATMTWDQKSP